MKQQKSFKGSSSSSKGSELKAVVVESSSSAKTSKSNKEHDHEQRMKEIDTSESNILGSGHELKSSNHALKLSKGGSKGGKNIDTIDEELEFQAMEAKKSPKCNKKHGHEDEL